MIREPWIRVHARLRERPITMRLAEGLRIDPHKAMGHLIDFWGGVSCHAKNGQIADQPDALLEQWAGWSGKRGAFAAWVRAHHMDADGRVNEWDEYAGALETRREKERQRVADKRAAVRTVLGNSTQGVAQHDANSSHDIVQPLQSVATRARERDGTGRDADGTEEQQQQQGADKPRKPRVIVTEGAKAFGAWWRANVGKVTDEAVQKELGDVAVAHGWDAVLSGAQDYKRAKGTRVAFKWFADSPVPWIELAKMPLETPTGEFTRRYHVLMGGKVA